MAKRSTMTLAAVAAVAVLGVVVWMALSPGGPPDRTPRTPEVSADTARTDVTDASPRGPSSGSEAPSNGRLLGRAVRGTPPRPVVASLRAEELGGLPVEATCAADGTFEMNDLPRDREFALVLTAPGTVPTRLTVLIPRTGPLDLGDVELGAAVGLDVVVTDAAGKPVADAEVHLQTTVSWSPGMNWVQMQVSAAAGSARPPKAAEGRTGADGTVRLAGAPPATYALVATARGFARAVSSVSLKEGLAMAPKRVILLPSVTLTGRVLDGADAPLPGVRVWADAPNVWSSQGAGRIESTSDEKGAWRLEGLAAGQVTLRVLTPGGLILTRAPVEVPGITHLDIRLDGSGTVQGRVVDDATGAAVAGAEAAMNLYDQNSGMQAVAVAVSDAEGKFRFEGLPPSTWVGCNVRMEGYLPATLEMGMQPILDRGGLLEGEARLLRGHRVAGKVTDGAGKAVAGASVEGRTWDPRQGLVYSPRVRSAEDGTFTLEGVALGQLLIKVVAEGYHQPDYPPNEWQAFQNGPMPEAWSLNVKADGGSVKDLVLESAGGVSGRVENEDGTPAAGYSVTVTSRKGTGGGGNAAPTDAEGKFHITSVAPGEELVVNARGPAGEYGSSDPFPLPVDGDATEIKVVVKAGSTVNGRVSREDGGALEGAVVRTFPGKMDTNQPWNVNWQRTQARMVPVAADGAFRIEGLNEGVHTVFATAPGAGPSKDEVVTLERMETKDGVDLVLAREVVITGTTVDESGKPVAGAEIVLSPVPKAGNQFYGNQQNVVEAISDGSGKFKVGGQGPDPVRVTASARGLQNATHDFDPSKESGEISLTLKPALSIAGVVTEADGGGPAVGVLMMANPSQPVNGAYRQLMAHTDPQGRFSIEGLEEGTYTVSAAQSWGQNSSPYIPETKTGIAAGTADLAFSLRQGLSITGRAVRDDGSPLGMMVSVQAVPHATPGQQPDWSKQRYVQSKGDGSFVVSGLETGAYDLTITTGSGPRGQSAFAPVRKESVAAGTTDLTITVHEGVSVRGRIVTPEGGAPQGRGQVQVFTAGSQQTLLNVRAEANGTFTVGGLDPGGTYDFVVQGYQGFAGGFLKGIVPGGGEITIVLDRGGTISGRVVTEDGSPVEAGVPVMLSASDAGNGAGRNGWAPTREGGTFTASGLGDFEFHVTAGGNNSAYAPVTSKEKYRPGATDVVITVKPGLEISGRVLDADGKPLKPQWLGAQPKGGGAMSWTQAKDDGSFVLKGLSAGTYSIKAWLDNGQVELGEAEAPSTNIELRLTK